MECSERQVAFAKSNSHRQTVRVGEQQGVIIAHLHVHVNISRDMLQLSSAGALRLGGHKAPGLSMH